MAEKTLDDAPGGGSGASDSEITVSGINERALLRKLDLRLLPAVGILYLLSFLDRSNGMAWVFLFAISALDIMFANLNAM